MARTSVELTPVRAPGPGTASPSCGNVPAQDQGSRQDFSLPPVDGGKDAWFFLAACFMLEGLVWGEIPCVRSSHT